MTSCYVQVQSRHGKVVQPRKLWGADCHWEIVTKHVIWIFSFFHQKKIQNKKTLRKHEKYQE